MMRNLVESISRQAALRLVDARTESDLVQAFVLRAVKTGWGEFNLRHQMHDYFAAVAGGRYTDLSVAVLADESLCAIVLANDAHGRIGYFGRPLFLAFAGEEGAGRDAIELALFDHYAELARAAGLPVDFIAPRRGDSLLGPLALKVAGLGGVSRLECRAVVDLTAEEADIRRNLRKSYRSLVNWGERHLETVIVNHENADHEVFDAFQAFHARMAGRQTRPQASWDRMFDNLLANRAELVAGYLDGTLLAGTFVNYSPSHAIYATGVYERGRFDKPLSHWPVYLAILRAKRRGCRTFDLGEIFLGPERDEKERNIAFFKKGFTDRVEMDVIWRLAAPADQHSAAGEGNGNVDIR